MNDESVIIVICVIVVAYFLMESQSHPKATPTQVVLVPAAVQKQHPDWNYNVQMNELRHLMD